MTMSYDDLLAAIPAHQRASAKTALARLEQGGLAAQVVAAQQLAAEILGGGLDRRQVEAQEAASNSAPSVPTRAGGAGR